MLFMIYTVASIVIFFLVYRLLYYLFGVEEKKTLRKFENTKTKKVFKKNPRHLFAKFIIVPAYKKEEMERGFKSLSVKKTVEEYYSECIYSALLPTGLAILFFSMKSYLFCVLSISAAGWIFLKKKGRLYRALTFRRISIEEEAPNMIRFFITELGNKEDVKVVFEKYREIAKYLKPDIEKTILDMNATISEKDVMVESLQNLDERLNTQITRDFITGLIDALSGKDQTNYFAMLERDLKIVSLSNLERKSKKVDITVRNAMFVMIFAYIFFMASMMSIYMIHFMSNN